MTEPTIEGLTPEEHYAMTLSAELGEAVHQIIGEGPNAAFDWNEMAIHLHGIQNAILKQAAARLYPEMYRLLGASLNVIANAPVTTEPIPVDDPGI